MPLFLAVAFLAGVAVAVAFLAAHRFLRAATIAALPAAESLRFGLAATGEARAADEPLDTAHRLRCASAMRFRAAALLFLRLVVGTSGAVAGSTRLPPS